jgi:hypothetical protein
MGSIATVAVGRYVLGVTTLLATVAALGFAALVIRRRVLPTWSGAPARLAETVILFALLTAVLEALGTLGLFRLAPILVSSILIGAVASWSSRNVPRQRARVDGAARQRRLAGSVLALLALAAAVATVAEWGAPTLESYDVGIRSFDSLWYHLPWAASFAQTGQITSLRFTDVEYLTAFYPATAELLHGLGIVFLSRDTLSPGLNLLWLGLGLLAGYCVGRPRGAGAVTMTGAALAMATPMVRFSQAGSAANDVVGVFFVLAAIALLINGPEQRAALALAAVAGGLAIAVKLSMLAPVAALTVGVLVISLRRGRRGDAVWWLVPLVLAGGFWYVRNLIAVGNPLPWISLPGLATPAAPLQAHTGYAVAHYLTSGHVLSAVIGPGLASGLGPWWAVIVALAVIGPLLCLLPGAGPLVRMLGVVALTSLAGYLVTPETAAGPAGNPLGFAFNLRYAAPALTLSLTILPLAPVLAGSQRRLATQLVFLVVLAATIAQARLWPAQHVTGTLILGAVVLLTAIVVALTPRRGRRASGGLAVAALIAASVGGYALQRHYLRGRYVFHPGVSELAGVWAYFRHVHDARVGIVGTFGGFFSYPLYGLDLSNTVHYVALRGPHGSFTQVASCPRWRAAVNAGRFSYLVTTPARDPWRPRVLGASPEDDWTRSDPAARLVYTHKAGGQRISIYALTGPLHASSCPPSA